MIGKQVYCRAPAPILHVMTDPRKDVQVTPSAQGRGTLTMPLDKQQVGSLIHQLQTWLAQK
jgi:hypothetical protein